MASTPQAPDITMDAGDLYREDIFTDNRVGTLRRLTPVDADGETDTARSVRFVGSTQILTPAGALPLNFEIEADNLADAAKAFGPAAEKALEKTMEELREMQREAASSIVVPKGGIDPGGNMGGMGGSGGGRIQRP